MNEMVANGIKKKDAEKEKKGNENKEAKAKERDL